MTLPNPQNLGSREAQARYFARLLSEHNSLASQGARVRSYERVREFLQELHEDLSGQQLEQKYHDLALDVYYYWYQIYPRLVDEEEPDRPEVSVLSATRRNLMACNVDWKVFPGWLPALEEEYGARNEVFAFPRGHVLFDEESKSIRISKEAFASTCVRLASTIRAAFYVVHKPLELAGDTLFMQHTATLLRHNAYVGYVITEDTCVGEFHDWADRWIRAQLKQDRRGDAKIEAALARLVQFPTERERYITNYGFLLSRSGELLGVKADKTDGMTDYLISMEDEDAKAGLKAQVMEVVDGLYEAAKRSDSEDEELGIAIDWLVNSGVTSVTHAGEEDEVIRNVLATITEMLAKRTTAVAGSIRRRGPILNIHKKTA